jgi:hypothetical protein
VTTFTQDVLYGLVMLTVGVVIGVCGALLVIDADIRRASRVVPR